MVLQRHWSLLVEQKFKYDNLKRLIEAEEYSRSGLAWRQKFVYDRFRNRRFDASETTTLPAACATAVCNPEINPSNNRIADGQGYGHDASGNVIQTPENLTSVYDGDNKLAEVRLTGTATTVQKNFYDGSGARVRIEQGDSETVFVHDASGRVVAEYSRNVPQNPNPTTAYLTLDLLGSVRVVTDSIGKVITRRDFLPFGEEIASGTGGRSVGQGYLVTDTVRPKFTGQERDESVRLDYFNARHYDFPRGRFASADTAGGKQSNPQTLNLYAYALNNPLRWVDPTGHSPDDPPDIDCSVHVCSTDSKGRNHLFVDNNQHSIPVPGEVSSDNHCGCAADAGESDIQRIRELESSLWDYVPVIGGLRQMTFYMSCGPNGGCNFNRAFVGFATVVSDLTPYGMAAKELNIARGLIIREIISESTETGITSMRKFVQVQANRQAGKLGESMTEAELKNSGTYLGKQVTFETSNGKRTVIDFLETTADGIGAVETKTGNGKLTSGQKQFFDDILNGRPVTPRGRNAAKAGLRLGEPIPLQGARVARPF